MLAVLLQIDAWDPAAAAPVVLQAASHDDPALCMLNGATWWPAIAKLPTLRYDLFDGDFSAQISAPSSSLTLQSEPWSDFGRYTLADGRIRLWTGELGADWSGFTLRFDGRVSSQPALADGQAPIDFAVDDRWLDQSLLATYAGTTGAEGPAALKGQAKPLAIGAPRYAAGTLIDSVNSVFQVSAYGPIQGFEAALEKLARFGAPIGDAVNYASLIAADVPAGTWATCNAQGMARFGAPPAGQVSFLIQGDTVGGWSRKPGQVITRLATLGNAAARLDTGSLAALDAARPYNLSLMLTEQGSARDLIQKVAASVNAVAGVSWTGQLFAVPVALGVPLITLAADGSMLPPVASLKQIENAAPWQKLAISAERAWTVHQLADIAFEAPLIDRGRYDPNETYREGNIVDLADGSRWLYEAYTPSSGNAPAQHTGYWYLLSGATEVGVIPPTAIIGGTVGPDGTISGGKPASEVLDTLSEASLNALFATTFTTNKAAELDALKSLQDGSALTVQINNLVETVNDPDANGKQSLSVLGAVQPDSEGGLIFVVSKSTALGTPDQVIGQILDQLIGQVAGHETTITSIKEIVAGTDGSTTLRAMTELDEDGTVTGFYNTLTNKHSDFKITTDVFRVTTNGAGGKTYTPFLIEDGIVKIPEAEIAVIRPGTRGTTGIPTIITNLDTYRGKGGSVNDELLSGTVTLYGPGTIDVSAVCNFDRDGANPWSVWVEIDGVAAPPSTGVSSRQDVVPLLWARSMANPGTYTVRVLANIDSKDSVKSRTMRAFALHGVS